MIMSAFKSITVGIPVTNVNSAVEWYRRLLGGVEELNPAPGVWEFQLTSSAWLQIFEGYPSPSGLTVVRIETDNVGASHELASSLGVEVGDIEIVPNAVEYFDFRDPFGNQLSFYKVLE